MVESLTFRRWLHSLRDRIAAARINVPLRNVSPGSAGDGRAVGNGLFEMRVPYGPGYRLYGQRRRRRRRDVWRRQGEQAAGHRTRRAAG